MARPKKNPDIYYTSISTRINVETAKRLDQYCDKTNTVRATLIDQAINDFLDKIEMTH